MSNLTNEVLMNITSMSNMVQTSNSVLDGWLGTLILITIFITLFLAMKSRNMTNLGGMISAGFVVTILSIFFRAMEIVTDKVMFICIIAMVFMAFFLIASSSGAD